MVEITKETLYIFNKTIRSYILLIRSQQKSRYKKSFSLITLHAPTSYRS